MSTVIRAVRSPEEPARAFAYRVLALYIEELFFLPGEKLVESEIAAQLGISRTPVHDTFVQLSREKLLSLEPRGAFVPPLSADSVRQLAWMHQTVGTAVLETLYNLHPPISALEPLERCAAEEYAALTNGSLVRMAHSNRLFYGELYKLAGYVPVYRALCGCGSDLYRLYRLADDRTLWQFTVDQHAALVQALALHHFEDARDALNAQFDLIEPLLQEWQRRLPRYFV